jgi:hypothetical protein
MLKCICSFYIFYSKNNYRKGERFMRKLLSVVLAMSLVCSLFTIKVSAANSNITYSATDINVSIGHDDVSGVAGVTLGQWAGSPTYTKGKVYKEEGILGLSSGEYGIELIAKEQRSDQPYLAFAFGDIDASQAFYYSMNVYIGQQRAEDRIYIGSELKDASGNSIRADKNGFNSNAENFNGFKIFYGNGAIKLRSDLGNGTSRQNGTYSANNWVNYTIAGDGTNLTLYIDGVAFTSGSVAGISGGNLSCPFSGTIKDVSPVVRLETGDSVTGTPSFVVVKDVKLVAGAYTASKSSALVTGDGAYTLPSNTIELGSAGARGALTISGVSASSTVSTFLSHITAPSGGSVSVIKINPATKATETVSAGAAMTPDMKLLAKSQDGSMKLYDIELSDTPTITSSLARYSIDDTNKIITMPDTTVGKLTRVVTGTSGTTVKVVTANGTEVTSGTVRDTMKLVAEKNGVEYKYSIDLGGNTVAYNIEGTSGYNCLGYIADNTVLFDATIDNPNATTFNTTINQQYPDTNAKSLQGLRSGDNGYLGFAKCFAKQTSGTFNYNVTKTKMPTSTSVSAYHVTKPADDNWLYHFSNALALSSNTTNTTKGDKMIVHFKVSVGSGGGFAFWPMHTVSGSGGYELQTNNSTNKWTSDKIIFSRDNKIMLGGERRDWGWGGSSGSWNQEKGTFTSNQEYDVVVVESRGTTEYDGTERLTVVTEAVYIDGTDIADGPQTCVILDGRAYDAIRDFAFATTGDVYFGGLTITMADNYDPTTPSAASLAISSASIEVSTSDTTITGSASKTIRGYTGTVAALKSAITKDANAELQVLDKTGTSVLSDSTALSDGMFLKVVDVNDEASYETYFITNEIILGDFATSKEGSVITLTRTVKAYRNEGITLWLISARQNGADTELKQFSADQKAIDAAGTYNFSTTINAGDSGDNVRFMLWDTAYRPYCKATLYSE